MNENKILDNPDIEDINIESELEDLIDNGNDNIPEDLSSSDEINIDFTEESSDELEISESTDELDIEKDINVENQSLDDNIENEPLSDEDVSELESIEDDTEVSIVDATEEDEELSVMSNEEDSDLSLEEESIESETEVLVEEEIEEDSVILDSNETILDEESTQTINSDENFITNDLQNIDIEFGIEAKGFILSLKMMEAMIEKGYIFKDILNDKIFDAVMIFNGNLENTVMTNDIKIKIEDGKIQLIKG